MTTLEDSPLRITGRPEVVFDSSSDKCKTSGRIDNPDAPAIAFRRADGRVVLIASNTLNFYFEGDSLNTVRRVCHSLITSAYSGDPASYRNWEWIRSAYTTDGTNVLALIHNEYHGWEFSDSCAKKKGAPNRDFLNCWWASVTYASSNDAGRTFKRPDPPANMVAALPYAYQPNNGHVGISSPTQIVRNPADGRYHVLVHAKANVGAQKSGMCLLRGATLDPTTWRAWDGKDFNVRFADPYGQRNLKPADHVCEPVYGGNLWSVLYSNHLKKFLALGRAGRHLIITQSSDLIHWSTPARVLEFINPAKWADDELAASLYYSLLDPNSPSLSFDQIGKSAYLYFVRWQGSKKGKVDNRMKDLVRVPVQFH